MNEREINARTGQIVDAAMRVHRVLGPGLLESAYLACLAYELRKRGHRVLTEVDLPVIYEEVRIELGYRIDMLIDDAIVVELKAHSKMLPVYDAQLLSYLKMGRYRIGLLINFHSPVLKDGIKRMVNGL